MDGGKEGSRYVKATKIPTEMGKMFAHVKSWKFKERHRDGHFEEYRTYEISKWKKKNHKTESSINYLQTW